MSSSSDPDPNKHANFATLNETDGSDCETVTSRTPLRKKAVFVLPPSDVEAGADSAAAAPQISPEAGPATDPSPTTKAKNANSAVHGEKRRACRLRALVASLFLAIVFLVGFAYIVHYQQLLKKAYLERIRFVADERLMRIFDVNGVEAVRVHMGAAFPAGETPFDCRRSDRLALEGKATDGSTGEPEGLCVEWPQRGRLSVTRETPHRQPGDAVDPLRCYRVQWKSLSADTHPTDCFDMGDHLWYGGGVILGRQHGFAGWPLNKVEVPMNPFATGSEWRGRNGWGPVLRRYFVSSRAAAIVVDDAVPLWVSVNANQSQQLCLQARANVFPFDRLQREQPSEDAVSFLNYTVCTTTNIEVLEKAELTDITKWDGLREQEMEVMRRLMETPIWRFDGLSADNGTADERLAAYGEAIADQIDSPAGYLLVDSWERHAGDFEFDENRFPRVSATLEKLHELGFRVAVTVRPFVSTFSETYRAGLELDGGAWIGQGAAGRSPALTTFDGDASVAVADVTSASVSQWLADRLRSLVVDNGLDGIVVESSCVDRLPPRYATRRSVADPSALDAAFLDAAKTLADVSVIAVTSATKMPRLPTFIALPRLPSTWRGLQALVPLVLTLGVSGYPFLMPPPVGGFATPSANETAPERELFLRWMQVSAFLPVVQFATLPTSYDDQVSEMVADLMQLRKTTVLPLLQKHGGDSLISALPIIRPLWMLEPTDRQALDADDEFCVGDELLVAPVLHDGRRQRDVYLPSGVWKDGLDGSLRSGGRVIRDHPVALDQVAHFIRMPDGTRL